MVPALRTCLLCLLLACAAAAFQATGKLSGTLEDAAGRPVAGARVTLSLAESSVVYLSTLTSRDGSFLFASLKPAVYDVTVGKLTLRNVRVDPAAETSLPPIHLGNAQAFQTADDRQMSRLPLPQRDPLYLAETLPGVQNNGRAPLGIYGESAALANVTYDGMNVGPTGLRLRTDQIGEATVVTGSIEGCGCSQLAFSTPGGGREFHGAAYWLALPSPTAAQYWADNSRNTPSATSLNQLGASVGGPLKRDHLFFFLNYEADLDRSTETRTGVVPAAPLTSRDPLMQQVLTLIPSDPSGAYRGVQNNGSTTQIALARLDYLRSQRHSFSLTFADRRGTTDDPADSSVFGPQPTTTIGLWAPFYSASWRWSPTARVTNEVRAGGNLADIDFRNSLRSRFGFIAILDDPARAVSQPMSGLDPERRADHQYGYQDNLTWVAGRHILEAGLWFQQYRLNSDGSNNGPLDSLTVPRYLVNDIAQGTISQVDQRFNIASPTSGYAGGSTARSRLFANMISGYVHDNWKLLPSLTISLGLRYDYLSRANERTGAAIIPVLSGTASDAVYDQNLTLAFASSAQPFYRKDFDNYSPYVGLAWRPSAKLPLIARGGFNIAYLNDDLLPNLSIYALRNPFQSFDVSTDLSAGPVTLSHAPATPAPVLPSNLTLASLLSFANGYHQEPGPVYAIDWNIRTPNVKYWNVGVESALKGFQVDVRYVGNRLEEGPRSINRNQVMMSPDFLATFLQVQAALKSGAPTNGFPGLLGGGLGDSYARSLILTGQAGELARWYQGQGYNAAFNYNFLGNPLAPQGIDLLSQLGVSRFDALQVSAARHAAAGLDLTASYVFSKVLSTLDDYRPGAIDPYLNLHNPSLEWAPSPFNLSHAFKAAAIWDIPAPRRSRLLGGWSVAGIVIAQSGAPFSLLSGLGTFASTADSGQNTVATSLTAGQIRQFFGIRKSSGGIVSYVNAPAGAFAEPAPGALGTLQRRMFTGPGAFNLNLGLRKTVRLSDRLRAEFRAESINLLNNANWLVADQTYLGANAKTSLFDNNVAQWNSPRTFQFSLRLLF
jgi:hypothetical protein